MHNRILRHSLSGQVKDNRLYRKSNIFAQRRKGAKKYKTRFSSHYRAKNSFKLQATKGLLVLIGEADTNRGFLGALAS